MTQSGWLLRRVMLQPWVNIYSSGIHILTMSSGNCKKPLPWRKLNNFGSWFSRWKANIDRAKELQQTLYISYFEGQVGAGRLSWDELHVEEARHCAAKAGGLGASQKAEVAYLDKLGLSYVEHEWTWFFGVYFLHYSIYIALWSHFEGLREVFRRVLRVSKGLPKARTQNQCTGEQTRKLEDRNSSTLL